MCVTVTEKEKPNFCCDLKDKQAPLAQLHRHSVQDEMMWAGNFAQGDRFTCTMNDIASFCSDRLARSPSPSEHRFADIHCTVKALFTGRHESRDASRGPSSAGGACVVRKFVYVQRFIPSQLAQCMQYLFKHFFKGKCTIKTAGNFLKDCDFASVKFPGLLLEDCRNQTCVA